MRPVPRPRTRLTALTALLGLTASAAVVGAGVLPAEAAPAGTSYYVSCHSGKATGSGTMAAPWSALWQVQSHGDFGPGDQILLARGTTCHGGLTPGGSGAPGAPIVLGQYGSGRFLPTVSGDGTRSNTGAVQLTDVAYWTVRDLHITNTDGKRNTRVPRAGLLFESRNGSRQRGLTAANLTIDHVDSDPTGRRFGGIVALTHTTGGGFEGMRITGDHVVGVGRTGIIVTNLNFYNRPDSGLRIDHNMLRWVRGDSIIVDGANDSRIDDNTSAYGSNLSDCPKSQCGPMGSTATATSAIWPTHAKNIRIDHNEVYGEHGSAGDGDGIDVDLYSTGVVVEQNYIHDNARSGIEFCGARNTTARFNVLQHNHASSVVFTCGWQKDQQVKNITIANNTIVSDPGAAWVVRSMHPNPGAGIRFVNNLVSCSGACAYSWPKSHPTFSSNTFSGSHSWTEPGGPGSVDSGLGLRSPGHAGIGFASAAGYHLAGGRPRHGIGIGGGLTDFFGHAVSASKPVRGAASA